METIIKTRDAATSQTGIWGPADEAKSTFDGHNGLYSGAGFSSYTFDATQLDLPTADAYDVYIWNIDYKNGAVGVEWTIDGKAQSASDLNEHLKDQKPFVKDQVPKWHYLGTSLTPPVVTINCKSMQPVDSQKPEIEPLAVCSCVKIEYTPT